MPMYNIPIEERVTTLYQINAPTAKAAEEAALHSHLSTEQPDSWVPTSTAATWGRRSGVREPAGA